MNRNSVCILLSCITMINGQLGERFPYYYRPRPPFPPPFVSDYEDYFPQSFRNNFRATFHTFSPFVALKFPDMEDQIKPMAATNAKTQMQNGVGGVTIIETPGKMLLKKEGTTFECLGKVVPQKPFCNGQLIRFQIRSQQDYCFSEHYSQLNDMLCIAHNEQNGLNFSNNNGQYTCNGSDERDTLLINVDDYAKMCGRLPWESTYNYFPDPSHPFHVQLPNPDLKCAENRVDVCVFKIEKKTQFE